MAIIANQQSSINCNDEASVIKDGGQVVHNSNGTISVFLPDNTGSLVPTIITYACCRVLNPKYTFDINSQTCRWSEASACSVNDVIKLVLNPKGNDGTLFYTEDNDECSLSIDFDYLFKIKCESLVNLMNPSKLASIGSPNAEQIKNLENQLGEQEKICSSYGGIIDEYSVYISRSRYSIVCDSIPTLPVFSGPIRGVKSISSSAFGKIAPFGLSPRDSLVAGQIYCINEPSGLDKWRLILGNIRYNDFITGKPNSYTCDDVATLFNDNNVILVNNDINGTLTPTLLDACDTPINTKSDLVSTQSSYVTLQANCQVLISSLNEQITQLQGSTISLCSKPLDAFETLDVSLSIDVVTSANTLQSVFTYPLFPAIGTGNLYTYLSANTNSGFYVCGDPSVTETGFTSCTSLSLNMTGITSPNIYSCESIVENIGQDLFGESGLSAITGGVSIFENIIKSDALASKWLHYHTVITDPNIIALIANQKIKLSLKINHACTDFCVLIDEIVLDKVCSHVSSSNIFLTQSPGFELDRIRDNKKSWIANTTPVNRPFVINNNKGNNGIRQTNYDVNDERLVINSKEIDLDISLASAIETDVWCYLVDNPCLLTGITSCNPCGENCGNKTFQDELCCDFMDDYLYEFMDGTGDTLTTSNMKCCGDNMIDFKTLLIQPLSAITTVEDFEYFMQSELIDAKNRQTLSGYPTLRALYDRYMNSGLYCGTDSSKFDYLTMDQFAGLVGNYWVDIVEQVIPATTIWGSVKIYSNTIFDQQKYKYRAYSSLFCGNPFSGNTVLSPINAPSGTCTSVSVSITPIVTLSGETLRIKQPVTSYCDSLCLAQWNAGSEFIGMVTIVGSAPLDCSIDSGSINECPMQISVDVSNAPIINLIIVAGAGDYTYQWSNGDTGATTTMSSGDYSVTVMDKNCCTAAAEFTVPIPQLSACWYNMPEKPNYVIDSVYCDYYDYTAVTFNISSMVLNGAELITDTGYTTTITSANTNIVSAANGITTCQGNNVTYSNFVDLVNQMFIDLGLTDHKAQLSLVAKPTYESGSPAGFYIIRPDTDTFTITTNGVNYTETGVFSSYMNTPNPYYEFICGDFLIEDGVVTE